MREKSLQTTYGKFELVTPELTLNEKIIRYDDYQEHFYYRTYDHIIHIRRRHQIFTAKFMKKFNKFQKYWPYHNS